VLVERFLLLRPREFIGLHKFVRSRQLSENVFRLILHGSECTPQKVETERIEVRKRRPESRRQFDVLAKFSLSSLMAFKSTGVHEYEYLFCSMRARSASSA
jgi:hypothetical protein